MIVSVDESAVGVGKTQNQILRAVATSARYLFVVERLDSMTELEQRIRAVSSPKVILSLIRGNEMGRGMSGSPKRRSVA
jgi:hypothetical protein